VGRIIFVTGTDTGVGKTLLTAMLLVHLRDQGKRVLALKPFCSGSRSDALLLHHLQSRDITLDEVNPFHFEKPLAPYLAAGPAARDKVRPSKILRHIKQIGRRCDLLLVEGAGGLFVPLGKNWYIRDLISELSCEVILVARNQLGTINHTLLAERSLAELKIKSLKVVLMGQKKPDLSTKTNLGFLKEVLDLQELAGIPYLSARASQPKAVEASAKRLKKVLAGLVA
jgi:dethiobiotin synthetase